MKSIPPADSASNPTELIEQAVGGSREAFALLVRQHHRVVRAFVGRLIHDADAAEDLAQEAFLAAYQHLAAYQRDGEFLSWLLGIARHKALSYLRAKSRRLRHERNVFEQAMANWQCQRTEAVAADGERELLLQRQLQQCLDQLAPKARQIVDEHYFRGRTAEAMAAASGKKAGTVRMLLMRIRQALADCIHRKSTNMELLS